MMYCKYFIPEDNYHKPICTFNFNEAICNGDKSNGKCRAFGGLDLCDCWHKVTPLKQNSWINCHRNQECWGTREREECSCNGHKINCDFYEDIRNKAFEKTLKKGEQ
mgnify:CR=1 FL=1